MPACTICNHPKRDEINRALINNSGSGREIAGRFDLKKSSVDRHRRNHLRPHLAQLIAEDPELAELNPLAEIKALYYRVRHLLDKAEDANDLPAFRAFHAEARKDLEVLAKIVGDIDERPQIYISPMVQEVIVQALLPFPEARREVSRRLKVLEGGGGQLR